MVAVAMAMRESSVSPADMLLLLALRSTLPAAEVPPPLGVPARAAAHRLRRPRLTSRACSAWRELPPRPPLPERPSQPRALPERPPLPERPHSRLPCRNGRHSRGRHRRCLTPGAGRTARRALPARAWAVRSATAVIAGPGSEGIATWLPARDVGRLGTGRAGRRWRHVPAVVRRKPPVRAKETNTI